MGQKVHPYGFRLGITKPWLSRWFVSRQWDYTLLIFEDKRIREMVKARFPRATISRIEIERKGERDVTVIIYTSRPGLVIGRKGETINRLRQELARFTGKSVEIEVKEVQHPEVDAQLVAENIAVQIERRVNTRRAMKRAIARALATNLIKGIKVRVSGRLNGADIARSEWYLEGRMPLQTLYADIDYGFAEAQTIYGTIGVKVWIYKGDYPLGKYAKEMAILEKIREKRKELEKTEAEVAAAAEKLPAPKERVPERRVARRPIRPRVRPAREKKEQEGQG